MRGARQPECRQVAAVRTAPDADAERIHVGAATQVDTGPEHVLELARPARAVAERLAELQAVADPAPVVDGEDDVAAARQVLIEGVGVVVVLHVVPAEQHLAPRAAVEERDGGPLSLLAGSRGQEELAVDLRPVRGQEDDGLRHDQVLLREARGHASWVEVAQPPVRLHDRRPRGAPGIGPQHDGPTAGDTDRGPLDALAPRHGFGAPARDRHLPRVPPIDVALVRGIENAGAVGREGDVLDLEVAGRQERRLATGDGHRVEMRPAVRFPREGDPVAGRPQKLLSGAEPAEDAPPSRPRPPDEPTLPRRDIRQPDLPGMPLALGHERVRLGVGGQPQERDLVPVLREHGSHVGVDTRIEPADRVPADVEHPHVRVVPAAAHERHSPTVRRPAQTRDLAARLEECLGLGSPVERRNLSPALVYEGHAIPRRRHDRRVPLSELLRLASRDRHDPHSLLRSARIARRIRILALPVRVPSADKSDGRAIRREGQVGKFLAVVRCVARELAGLVGGRLRHPDVADAPSIEHPGEFAAAG